MHLHPGKCLCLQTVHSQCVGFLRTGPPRFRTHVQGDTAELTVPEHQLLIGAVHAGRRSDRLQVRGVGLIAGVVCGIKEARGEAAPSLCNALRQGSLKAGLREVT